MSEWLGEIAKELSDTNNILRGIKHELYQLRMLKTVELNPKKEPHRWPWEIDR